MKGVSEIGVVNRSSETQPSRATVGQGSFRPPFLSRRARSQRPSDDWCLRAPGIDKEVVADGVQTLSLSYVYV